MRVYKYYLLLPLLWLQTGSARAQVDKRQEFDKAPRALRVIIQRADSCMYAGGTDCDSLYKVALRHEQHGGAATYRSTLYCKLGNFYFNTGAFAAILRDIRPGLVIAQKRKEHFNAGFMLNLIAAAHSYQTLHTDSALHYFLQARMHWQAINDSLQLAQNYSNTASVYVDMDDDRAALTHYKMAWAYAKSVKTASVKFNITHNYGLAYLRLGIIDSAYHWAVLGTPFIDPEDTYEIDWQIANANILFADVYAARNQLDSARYCADIAVQSAIMVADSQFLADAYAISAKVYFKQKNYKQAIVYASKSRNISLKYQDLKGLTRGLSILSESYLASGQFKAAANCFKQSLELLDTTVSQRNVRAVREVNAKYEAEKKERQLTEQQLIIQGKDAQLRSWLVGGGALCLGLLLFLFQYRRTQARKFNLLAQEKENAVLKAVMSGEERERNRISRDLHDGVAAMLGAARMSLQSIPFLEENKRNEQLEKLAILIGNTHTDIRRMAHDLLPVVLEREGLIPALQQFFADLNQIGFMAIRLSNELPETFALPQRIELVLYRIIQELINNIIKHAQATEAIVTLAQEQRALYVTVADNGIGWNQASESQGLYSIKERLKALGGTFDINGAEGQGTRASLTLHL